MTSGQYQRATGRLPDWYAKQPPIVRGDDFFLGAFSRLSTTRAFPGNGIGPIPWHRAWEYGERYGLGRAMNEYFVDVVLLLDGHYREHLRSQREQEEQKEERAQKRKSKRESRITGIGRRRR